MQAKIATPKVLPPRRPARTTLRGTFCSMNSACRGCGFGNLTSTSVNGVVSRPNRCNQGSVVLTEPLGIALHPAFTYGVL